MKYFRSAAAIVACSVVMFAGCGKPADSGWSGYAEGEYIYIDRKSVV